MENKTHYRKVFKSDHLGVPDLEDLIEQKKSLIFTIVQVKQEINVPVAGRKGNYNIAYFKEDIKPLVLNATNSKVVKGFTNSPFVQDWVNVPVELHIDYTVKMKGETVGGVRILGRKPIIQKPVLTLEHPRYEAAKKAWNEGKQDGVKKQYNISPEIQNSFTV